MKILTSVVNNVDFIEIQYYTLKKYFKNDYEYIVFNDSKPYPDFTNGQDREIHKRIENKCKELGIKCIPVPNEHQKNMDCPVVRCAEAMNFMYDYMLKNIDEYLIIDSDMFLIDFFDIKRYRDYDCAVVLQKRESLGKFSYIWNGLFYFNLFKMENRELINWGQLANSDVGGLTNAWLNIKCNKIPDTVDIRRYPINKFNCCGIYFIKHLWSLTWDHTEIPNNLKDTKLEQFMKTDPRNKNGKYYCEIYDEVFLHYRGGGDWGRLGLNFHNELTNRLKNVILSDDIKNDDLILNEKQQPHHRFKNIFSHIYNKNVWQDGVNTEEISMSGEGSTIDYNLTTYIPFLKNLIINNELKSVVDLGCGDFLCGPFIYTDLNIKYDGYDVYDKVIEINNNTYKNNPKYDFHCLDISNEIDKIRSADICILKDVLQHWKLKDIYEFLDKICLSKKFKFVLICNCCDQKYDNEDAYSTGAFRQLSANFFPLKRYNATIVYKYNTKEVSVINCQ